jgi:imidazoleglycerol phosphate dehydratase HisB
MVARTASIERKTNETSIKVAINLDCQAGSGNKQEISVSTGIGFLDHVKLDGLLFCTEKKAERYIDVPCSCETLWNVSDYEV